MHVRDESVDEVLQIVDAPAPLPDRTDALLTMLRRRTSHDAAWLTLLDHRLGTHALLATSGLDGSVASRLDRADVPVDGERRLRSSTDFSLWSELLAPADLRGGAGVTLRDDSGEPTGFLGVLRSDHAPSRPEVRRLLGRVAPHVARGLSPVRSLLATARMVPGAVAGVAVIEDGSTRPLPGLADHPLLAPRSPAVRVAVGYLALRQVAQSYLWPSDGAAEHGLVRLTALATPDVSCLVAGLLLLTPDVDRHTLTPRELEVLGLLVSGRSNQQIAHRLDVTPRTVATHVEHVMRKLRAPSRTLAAVRAEREGLFVPPSSPGMPGR